MSFTLNGARAWALASAVVAGALALASAAGAATDGAAGETSTVTRGDLTETLSWTGELAYANQASLTYKSGQADAGGPGGAMTTLAEASAVSRVVSSASPTVALVADAPATPSPSPEPSPEPSPTASAEPSPSASPEPTPTPAPTPTLTPAPTLTPTPTLTAPQGLIAAGPGGGVATTSGAATATTAATVGLVTWLPAAGSTVTSGGALYRVDNEPVVLLEGNATLYRDLAQGDTGDDVHALEEALAALGYGATMTVDQSFTSATAAALEDFQEAAGLEVTGELDLTSVVMHEGPVVVSTVVAAVGDDAEAGTEMLVIADPVRDVTVALDPSQLTSIDVGSTVSVRLPEGGTADAVVSSIAASPSSDGTYALTARLDQAAEVTGDHFTVTVSCDRALATDALLIDPYAIVLLEGNHTVVRVQREGALVDIEVTVIATAGRSTAVASDDLLEGDIIES